MKITFNHESNFDALKLATFVQDALANEEFECEVTELFKEIKKEFNLKLQIRLENRTLGLNKDFSLSGGHSTRAVWEDENGEYFSCATSFWRYIANSTKIID